MPNQHGDFIWYELLTPDQDSSRAFYEAIVGWRIDAENAGDDGNYRTIHSAKGPIAGALTLTEAMRASGVQPCWLGYIAVNDVDATAKAIQSDGGNVLMAPWDIPAIGRTALVTDPQGAAFYLMKPTPSADAPDAGSNSFATTEPIEGHCAWNELMTSDPAGAIDFYCQHFGWAPDGDMDMGPMGKYAFLKVGDERGFMLAGVMQKTPDMPVSLWNFYFRVPDIDRAVTLIGKHGGSLIVEPIEIPGGEFTLMALDPLGAVFGLIGPRR